MYFVYYKKNCEKGVREAIGVIGEREERDVERDARSEINTREDGRARERRHVWRQEIGVIEKKG